MATEQKRSEAGAAVNGVEGTDGVLYGFRASSVVFRGLFALLGEQSPRLGALRVGSRAFELLSRLCDAVCVVFRVLSARPEERGVREG